MLLKSMAEGNILAGCRGIGTGREEYSGLDSGEPRRLRAGFGLSKVIPLQNHWGSIRQSLVRATIRFLLPVYAES